MYQIIMFNNFEELNEFLKVKSDIIEEVKEFKHHNHVDYYHHNGEICNQWEEYTVIVKYKESIK